MIYLLRLALLTSFLVASARGTELTAEQKLEQLRPGMTKAEVFALLGPPASTTATGAATESDVYRVSALEPASNDRSSDSAFVRSGRVRCDFSAGVLKHIAGLWPKTVRPPANTPKTKVMLVDVAYVYDHLASTHAASTVVAAEKKEAEAHVAEYKAQGNRLVAAYSAAMEELKHAPKGSPAEAAATAKATTLLAQIHAFEREISAYVGGVQASLAERVQSEMDGAVPEISDALAEYERAHGYEYLFELRQSILSAGKKPLFVSGVDVSRDVVAWMNRRAPVAAGMAPANPP